MSSKKDTPKKGKDAEPAPPPPLDLVTLISGDDEPFEFVIERRCAMVSGTIKSMLCAPGQFTETERGEITFQVPKELHALVTHEMPFHFKNI